MKLLLIALTVFVFDSGCNRKNTSMVKLAGKAQGTTWHITFIAHDKTDYKPAIDSIFNVIDSSLSTWIPGSTVSGINKNDSTVVLDDHFINVFNLSILVSENTNGLFDITVAPVINAWGFGFTQKANADSLMIDSLLHFVGYKMVKIKANRLVKEKQQVMLDFNAIAPGYTVDVLSSYLDKKNISNYIIELGGEVRAKGRKNKNSFWNVGIDQPNETESERRPLKAIIPLTDRSLATSGNYRKFYMKNGKKFAHIIDPHTGYPAKHNLLSATVLADDCATADAYATAFMVMGKEKAKQFLSDHKELGLEVFFIYDENGVWKTYCSESLQKKIKVLP